MVYTGRNIIFFRRYLMRKSKLLACLLAIVLCTVSVTAAFAAPSNPREAIQAMKETACGILQDMGYNVVLGDNVDSIEASGNGELNSVTITTKIGNKFSLSFTKDGKVTEFKNHAKVKADKTENNPKLNKKTVKKIEKAVDSFLKKHNKALRKKIGKLKVVKSWTSDGGTFVRVQDAKKKIRMDLRISPSVLIWKFSDKT